MARAIWSGTISFGLVNVPVKLFSSVSKKTVRFHQLDTDGTRIQQKRVNPETGEEVPYERLVKGYELSPDRYVVVSPEELDALGVESTRTIDIEDFVDEAEIDPLFYDHPYYLAPAKGGTKAYGLLVKAMRESGRVAIGRFVMRSKEHLAAIRVAENEDALVMSTLNYADEIVDPKSIEELAGSVDTKTSKREVEMAEQLIASLSSDWEPEKYKDTYRDRVLELIEKKAAGEEIKLQPAPAPPKAAPDLMAALEASIAAVKERSGKIAGAPSGAGSKNGKDDGRKTAAKKPAAKKTAAKKPAAKRSTAKPK
jgi:DNA end-binding protein Ku